jgi:hypothetical protein
MFPARFPLRVRIGGTLTPAFVQPPGFYHFPKAGGLFASHVSLRLPPFVLADSATIRNLLLGRQHHGHSVFLLLETSA